jgi:hypothetical protein
MRDTSFISASLLGQLLLSWQARASVSFPDKQLSEELGRTTYSLSVALSIPLSETPTLVARGSPPGWGRATIAGQVGIPAMMDWAFCAFFIYRFWK